MPEAVLEIVEKQTRGIAELISVVEALIFVADEPISIKVLADVLNEDKETIESTIEELKAEFDRREGGLQLRKIAGGWQISTRTEFHEEIRKFLKTRPNAKLSLAALETLAVIAYKQPANDTRNFGNPRRAVGFGDQNSARQTPDCRQRSQGSRRQTDALRHVEGIFDSIRFEGFIGVAVNRRF